MFKSLDTFLPMLKNILILFLIAILGIFFVKAFIAYLLGLFLGTFLSVIKLLLLARAINKSVNLEPHDAKNFMTAQYVLRYFLTSVALFFVITNKNISTIGFIIGLLSLQISAYLTGFRKKSDNKTKNEEGKESEL